MPRPPDPNAGPRKQIPISSEEYCVMMDADYSGDIDHPDTTSTTTILYQGVLVYSAGEDKDPSTWEDNITTWDSGKKNSEQRNQQQ
ncbi:MAG: hypothetical protein ACKV19_00650 [Verrucomicrobiales bacterium]